ncbi:MAG TPA: YjbE family putative metal transport protein [Stellaceae bacterium]
MTGLIDWGALGALASVVLIDLTLAGDNAIVVGIAVSGLPKELRRRAMWLGIATATLLRIVLSAVALQLLALIGLTLAGGLLLLWVVWKLYRDWRAGTMANHAAPRHGMSLSTAIFRLVAADVSMSLDNVLAVAGAARHHFWVLVVGLVLSVALMGAASTVLIRLMARYRWIVAVGLLIVAVVAVRMIYEGSAEIWHRYPL